MGENEIGGLLLTSLVLALAVVAVAWGQRPSSAKTSNALGGAGFSLGDSWLTAFTFVFALVGALAGGGSWFSVVCLFFALLVGLSPLAYRATAANGSGSLGGYILAAVMVLWAAFGFLLTFSLLASASMAPVGSSLAQFLMMLVVVPAIPLIAVYAYSRLAAQFAARAGGSVSFL